MEKVDVLAQYLPTKAAPLIARWIDYFQCEFKISKTRTTKLGDYRHPYGGKGHRISVNFNLNQFAFLVTTVHEFAHLLTWNDFKNKVKPHGAEWKKNFQRMMIPFFEMNIFPDDIHRAIDNYMANPAASSCADLGLSRALKKYDSNRAETLHLEQLPLNTKFKIPDGRQFTKGERIRKRYRCVCLNDKRIYLFNPLATVFPVD
ncbi:SprT-like domain-containing protein [Pedobacter sandarakinus]|uniref:SprT-like domain-containing protein n=1 Tax=Pedobacter sandarakinus TaxID=353156 RepID=UPI00224526AB|nr:SprT-like domain-containing protein [Pedobacter sandarakinus]MCX2573359.1 SprT-like domain-containing protein [Pedobacter sandarakinus]